MSNKVTIKQKKKSTRKVQDERPISMVSTRLDTGQSFSFDVEPADVQYLHAYMNAHRLIPSDFEFGSARAQGLYEGALATVADPEALPDESLLKAIVVLGHCPSPAAIAALEGFTSRGHLHSRVAAIALEECLGMLSLGQRLSA